jgi:hypothetical protein
VEGSTVVETSASGSEGLGLSLEYAPELHAANIRVNDRAAAAASVSTEVRGERGMGKD